jgi:integrase
VTWEEDGYLLGQRRKLLFVWPNGNPLHPDTITALFHKHREAAGLPRIRLHDVRHSYATAALKAGISPKVISERLGHSSAAFTLQSYTHVIPGMDEMAADTVAKLILAEPVMESDPDGTIFGTIAEDENPEMQSAPGIPGADVGSGGRI